MLMVILFLIILEGGLRVINLVIPSEQPEHRIDIQNQLSVYSDKSWSEDYWREFYSLTRRFAPYLTWRRNEYQGEYINIDSEGIRETWHTQSNDRDAEKIFMFGGSTMWGTGARDNYTIPSFVSKKLHNAEYEYEIINYGESGYSITQEVVQLSLLLKQGNIPSYVIFYDGVNDISSSYQNGKAGLFGSLDSIRNKIYPQSSSAVTVKRPFYIDAIQDAKKMMAKWSVTYRTLANIKANVFGKQSDKELEEIFTDKYSKEHIIALAEETVLDYKNNIAFVKALSGVYGFEHIFIWQPNLFSTSPLTPEELSYKEWDKEYEQMVDFYRMVYDLIEVEDIPNFYNLASIFNEKESTVFIDWCHITEEANEVIADEIYSILLQVMNSNLKDLDL